MAEISLNARLRRESGKGVAHRLRTAGAIPGVFYLGHQINLPIELNAHELQLVLKQKPQLILLKLDDGSEHECVVRELQFDPISGKHLHVDLMGIVHGQKVTTQVPIELIGSAYGVRTQGGVLQHSIHDLNVECLPRHIPEKITVDITELQVGSSLHVRDLHVANLRLLDDPDSTVVTVLAPRVEKVVKEEIEEGAEEEAAEAEGEETTSEE